MASPVVDVYVKLPTGRTSVLKLMPSDCVSKINEQIGNEEGIPIVRVRMKYQGKILDKSKTIGYLGIRPETILKADIVVPKDLKIYAKVLGGASVPVDLQTTSTLLDLKSAIECLDEVTPKKVKTFKHSGNTYHPSNKPLFETSIKEESVIEVCLVDKKPKASKHAKGKKSSRSGSVSSYSEDDDTQETAEVDEDLKDTVLSSFQTDGKNVEVVFSFDTTGSMNSYLAEVRRNLKMTCQRLLRDIPNIRIGIIAHGDYCDHTNYVIKIQDLTSDVQQLVDFAENTPSTGGGDTPECYEWVLYKAKYMDWSENSAKALVVIGDYQPHPPSYTDQKVSWHAELDILKGMGVKVYGVYCNNSNGETDEMHFYEELADRTGGCLLKLANFNLITEMFLGVCYKESNQEQLEAFTEELKQEGKFTEETEKLMKQLEETKPKEETNTEETQNYLKKYPYPWWDFDLDVHTIPNYSYDAEEDKWKPFKSQTTTIRPSTSFRTSSASASDTSSPISPSYISKNRRQSKSGRKCSIM